jgi:magnesium transporter
MLIDCAHYVLGERQSAEPLTIEEAACCPRRGSSFVWVAMHEPAPELLDEVAERFRLHELAVEDAQQAHQRPKLEHYDDFHYIVFRTARFVPSTAEVAFGEVHMFVAPGYVITVRHGPLGFSRGAERLARHPQLAKSGPAAVVWAILDAVVDDYMPVVDAIETEIEGVEASVFSGHADQTERIYGLRQEVSDFYRAVHPLLAPLDALERGAAFGEIGPALKRYFRDVNDHLKLIHEEILAQRDQLQSVLEANVALVSVRQNEISLRQNVVTKQLTIIATVFLPLTFVTGFFGQNFGWLVDHIDTQGDFVVFGIGGLIVPCVALLAWFRRGDYL